MRLLEQLFRNLTEIVDEANGGILLQWIIDVVDVNVAFVEQVMEHVDSVDSRISLLLAAKDQINPLVQVLTNVIAFQRLPMHANELAHVLFGPRGQNYMVQRVTILLCSCSD